MDTRKRRRFEEKGNVELTNEKARSVEQSKGTKIFNVVSKIIGVLLLLSTVVFGYMMAKLDILPTKYMLPLLILLALILIASEIIIFKRHKKIKLKFVTTIIAAIIMLVLSVASAYMYRTMNFLHGIDNSSYNEKNYMVLVLNDSKYAKIEDLDNKSMLYYNNTTDNIQKIMKKIGEAVTVQFTPDESLIDMGNKLLNKETDSIVIEESYKKTIDEEIEGFEGKVKAIYTFSLPVEESTVDSKDVTVSSEPFNIYISGIDTYGTIASVSRSDVNMVITVNPNTHQILLTNIPRDYYVQLHGTSGTRDKLTHAGIYGTDMSIKTIEDLLDIDINYYLKVNFTSLIKIIDAIGGVTVYSNYTFTAHEGHKFKEGYNTMNGSAALDFARERKSFLAGDRTRGQNQQAVIEAIIKKATSSTLLTKFDSLLKSLEGSFRTNMPYTNMIDLVKLQIADMPTWTVTSISLDGAGSTEYTYSMGRTRLYVMIPYKEEVKAAQNLIDSVMNGDTLNGSYLELVTPSKTLVVQPSPKTTTPTNTNTNTKTNTDIKENDNQNNTGDEEEEPTDVKPYGEKEGTTTNP